MSSLIENQLRVMIVMAMAGITIGIIYECFQNFFKHRKIRGVSKIIGEVIYYLCVGYFIGEYFYYCDNGKITFTGCVSFVCGLWLWRRIICAIMFPAEVGEENEEEKRSSS